VDADFPYKNSNSTSSISIEYICSTSDHCTHAYVQQLLKGEMSWSKILSGKSVVQLTNQLKQLLYQPTPNRPKNKLQCQNGKSMRACVDYKRMCAATVIDDKWKSGDCISSQAPMVFSMEWSAVAKIVPISTDLGWSTLQKKISYQCNHDGCNYKGPVLEHVKRLAEDWHTMNRFFDGMLLKDQFGLEEGVLEGWSSVSPLRSSPATKNTSTRRPTILKRNSSINTPNAMNFRLTMNKLYCLYASTALLVIYFSDQ
jgi:hypothetical protein